MSAFRGLPGLRASLAAALGLTSAACGGDLNRGTVQDASVGDSTPAGDSAPGTPHPACLDPAPILVSGKDTGYDTCRGGTVRRRAIVECPTAPPPPSPCADASAPNGCTSNSACDAGLFGICQTDGCGCSCRYGCTLDSECAPGQICLCGDPVGACIPASCNAGTCGAGMDCASYSAQACPGCKPGFACQTSADTCFSDGDCDGGACSIDMPGAARACSYGIGGSCCSCGRPFLVDHRARVAALVERPDWRASAPPDVASLSQSVRSRLARHWTEVARMEHASIAAFARFVLQLLALGAPPDLVAGAERAMQDETRHARLAFGLASAYARADIGPGRFDVRGSLEAMDLRSILETTFAEGCIGETVAALEATEALEHLRDRDPAVAAVLASIAADEARHAELAWRSIAWMMSAFGRPARDALADALDDAWARRTDRGVSTDPRNPGVAEREAGDGCGSLLERGVLAASTRAAIRDEALRGVVVPLAKALLGGREDARTLPSEVRS